MNANFYAYYLQRDHLEAIDTGKVADVLLPCYFFNESSCPVLLQINLLPARLYQVNNLLIRRHDAPYFRTEEVCQFQGMTDN